VKEAVDASRRQHDRKRQRLTEQGQMRRQLRNIDQYTRAQTDTVEGVAIPSQSDLVGGPAPNDFEGLRGESLPSEGLEIVEGDDAGRNRAI
jgi:hypothetical protein